MDNYFNATGIIGFTCDNCGREVQGCTWVNGMKFCAKCYQETFGNNNMSENLKNMYDAYSKILDEKDKRIKELEEQLNEERGKLQQVYSRLGVEAFGEDIHEQALKELGRAIIPMFNIGQECWGIVPKTFWNKESYTIHFKVKAYIPDNNGIVLMLEDSITNLHYSYEWQVFATREEAEAKLKENK